MIECGKRYEVRDRHTCEIIARGVCTDIKTDDGTHKDMWHVSFDNKHYFNPKVPNLSIAQTDVGMDVPYTEDERYNMVYWNKSMDADVGEVDIYREYDIGELDPEVVDIVDELNRICGVRTVGSCSGHNIRPAKIRIAFSSLRALNNMTQPLTNMHLNFRDSFQFNLGYKEIGKITKVTTKLSACQTKEDEVHFVLSTIDIGDKAYKALNDLTEYYRLRRTKG